MSLVDRISQKAKERGHTFKSLEREVGLGNGTIKRWEVQSPRLDGLVKVAEYLQVSLDEIVFGDRQAATFCDGKPLTSLESDLIAMFRLLPADAQKEIFDLVHFKYSRLNGGEKESIYWTYFDESEDEKSSPIQGKKAQDETA